jgi:hypothetical protein
MRTASLLSIYLPSDESELSPNGHRVNSDKLAEPINTLLDLDGVTHIEVHDGSCSRMA